MIILSFITRNQFQELKKITWVQLQAQNLINAKFQTKDNKEQLRMLINNLIATWFYLLALFKSNAT